MQPILKAAAMLAYKQGQYQQVFAILRQNTFTQDQHTELQELWYRALYAETELTRSGGCRRLGAVEKYRLRRKHPLPPTIWDGEPVVYCFKARTRIALHRTFAQTRYPSPEEKQTIANQTGLTLTQVQ